MSDNEIIKDIESAENLVNRIWDRSRRCDPNIVYPLMELQTITDRLFKKYDDIKADRSLNFRFNEIIKNSETYRGDFTYNCDCRSKSKK